MAKTKEKSSKTASEVVVRTTATTLENVGGFFTSLVISLGVSDVAGFLDEVNKATKGMSWAALRIFLELIGLIASVHEEGFAEVNRLMRDCEYAVMTEEQILGYASLVDLMAPAVERLRELRYAKTPVEKQEKRAILRAVLKHLFPAGKHEYVRGLGWVVYKHDSERDLVRAKWHAARALGQLIVTQDPSRFVMFSTRELNDLEEWVGDATSVSGVSVISRDRNTKVTMTADQRWSMGENKWPGREREEYVETPYLDYDTFGRLPYGLYQLLTTAGAVSFKKGELTIVDPRYIVYPNRIEVRDPDDMCRKTKVIMTAKDYGESLSSETWVSPDPRCTSNHVVTHDEKVSHEQARVTLYETMSIVLSWVTWSASKDVRKYLKKQKVTISLRVRQPREVTGKYFKAIGTGFLWSDLPTKSEVWVTPVIQGFGATPTFWLICQDLTGDSEYVWAIRVTGPAGSEATMTERSFGTKLAMAQVYWDTYNAEKRERDLKRGIENKWKGRMPTLAQMDVPKSQLAVDLSDTVTTRFGEFQISSGEPLPVRPVIVPLMSQQEFTQGNVLPVTPLRCPIQNLVTQIDWDTAWDKLCIEEFAV